MFSDPLQLTPALDAVDTRVVLRSDVCSQLASVLPDKTFLPSSSNYIESVESYTFKTEQLYPKCIIQPTQTADVVAVMKILGVQYSTSKFAIRSGGHAPNAGSANVANGITIDMRHMNGIQLSQDTKIVHVEAGATWGDVYSSLLENNITVVGGRASNVGLGGFLNGGGLSYFGPRLGFGCDNIVNIEIVLASGQVVDANSSSNSDLFTALKGGTNNFGIVTRYDLKTVPDARFWGGHITHPSQAIPSQLAAFTKFKQQPHDENAMVENSYVYTQSQLFTINNLFYTKPVSNPQALEPFTDIQPQLANTQRISDVQDFSTELGSLQPTNVSGLYACSTFEITDTIISQIFDLWNATLPSITNVEGITYSLTFQSIPKYVPGNSMGLSPPTNGRDTNESLVLVLTANSWTLSNDNDEMESITKNLIDRIEQITKAQNLYHSYKHANYAANFQDPISSYGLQNQAHLLSTSIKYDPYQIFQRNVGGFKLH